MNVVLDYDKTEQIVVDHRCLHLVKFFRVRMHTIILSILTILWVLCVLSGQEEVPCHEKTKNCVANEFQSFIVFQSYIFLLTEFLRERLMSQCFNQPSFAPKVIANDLFNLFQFTTVVEFLVKQS